MCGIAGIIGQEAQVPIVRRMIQAQNHRGPDGDGFWSAPGVALGHCRLKVIDLSDAGKQPMSTPDGRYTIIYNGEVYNYRELRSELKGVIFLSQTDTEVVLQAYARWGADCLSRFMGMFAFAVWDNHEQRLFCARDRLGIKPFYYARLRGSLIFSSEIKGLLAAGMPAEANNRILYDFLARDFYEHTEETFFEGIRKIPPAGCMVINKDGGSSGIRRYWDLASDSKNIEVSREPREREDALIGLCSQAVDLHLRSDVPIGVALSGGLDSATLLALLDRIHPDPKKIEAFSFVFAEKDYSEQTYVETMAQYSGRKAHFVEFSANMFSETAQRFVASQEEPFAGVPISAYALCFALARQNNFIVIMDGSGIDEALAGYPRFLPAFWADLYLNKEERILDRELAASGLASVSGRQKAFLQIREVIESGFDIGKGQDLTNSSRPDCLNQEFVSKYKSPLPEFNRPFPDNLRNLMYRELSYTKLPRALRFRDRLSMAVGAELRPPFLDHRLLAYEFALPAEDRIHEGASKAILRRAARRFLPGAIRLAPKRSIQTPQREWFRHELRDWVRQRIDTQRFWQRGWIDKKIALSAMEAFFKGEGDNSFFLWQWINLELWAEEFIDKAVKN